MLNNLQLTRKDWWLAFGLTAVAVGSRLHGLGQWDFLVDEYATFYYASERMMSLKGPAYYAIVHVFFSLFGANEWSARIPAMIFGVMSIPIFYLTWRNVIGRYGAAIGAVLILVSSWHIWFSQFSRFYSAIFLFGSLSFYFYWQAITRDRIDQFVYCLLTALVGISFHFTMVLAPVACGVFSLLVLILSNRLDVAFSKRIAKISVAVYLLAGLALVPIALDRLGEWSGYGQQWGYGPPMLFLQIVKYIQVPICVAAFAGALQMTMKELGKGLFVFVAIAVPICVLLALSSAVSVRPDYMFFAYPLVFVAAGYACSEILSAFDKGNFIAHTLALILVASSMPEFVSHYTGHSSLDIRDAIAYIEREKRPIDRVLPFVGGFDHYSEDKSQIEERLGSANDQQIGWLPALDTLTKKPGRLWLVVPASREKLNSSFEQWLGENASLVWRKYQNRYDYTHKGFEIYVVR